jgi:hypothetical protein
MRSARRSGQTDQQQDRLLGNCEMGQTKTTGEVIDRFNRAFREQDATLR